MNLEAVFPCLRFLFFLMFSWHPRCSLLPISPGADSEVRDAWEKSARVAACQGAEIVEVSVPSVPQVSDYYRS